MLDDEAIAGALAVTDRFLTTFNDGDARGHAATLAYPHIRLASANVLIWSDIDEATAAMEQALAALRDRRTGTTASGTIATSSTSTRRRSTSTCSSPVTAKTTP